MNNDTPDTPDVTISPAQPGEQPVQVWKFTLVMAEVIFTCTLGVQTRRIQFISKSDGETFPRSRLLQLQKLAASNVVAEIKQQSNGSIVVSGVEAVYLLGTIDLGWMTEEDFLHSETHLVSASEMESSDNAPSPEATDNVVPLRPVDHHPV